MQKIEPVQDRGWLSSSTYPLIASLAPASPISLALTSFLKQLLDQAGCFQLIERFDTFAEPVLSQRFNLVFVQFVLFHNLLDQVLLFTRAVPGTVVAVPITTAISCMTMAIPVAVPIAISVSVVAGQKTCLLNVPVNIGLEGGKELAALAFNLANVADFLPNGQGVLV